MAWFRAGGGGIPSSLKGDMNDVFNKKFGTVLQDYPPEDWPGTVNLMGPLPEKTVSGSVVAFSDGADAVKLKSCAVTIAPTLDGISSVDVVNTGKNLIKPDVYQAASNILTLGQTDNTSFDTFLKAGTYTISYTTTGDSCYIYRREENDISNTNMGKRLSATFTLESDGNFRFWLYGDGAISANISDIQLEVGSNATAYAPYVQPTTHTAQLGRTIYGGEVDVVNGTGTETNELVPFSDCTWAVVTSYQSNFNADNGIISLRFGKNAMSTAGYAQTINGVACNVFVNNGRTVWNNANRLNEIGYSDGISVNLHYSDIGLSEWTSNSSDTLTAWRSCQLYQTGVFALVKATPETFTFTPVPIISRLGDNTMWGDGDLSVTYRRDIDLALAQ